MAELAAPTPAPAPGGSLAEFLHRTWQAPFFRNKLAVVGAVVVVVLLLMVLVPWLFSGQDPLAQDLSASLQPPSPEHILGTDKQGRDVWSRIVYGAQGALVGALLVVLISEFIGIPLGLLSGYYGGHVDTVVMRAIDMLLAFPALLLAILIVSTFGRGLTMAAIALGIVYVPMISRLVRSVTLVQRQQSYVEAARAQGFPTGGSSSGTSSRTSLLRSSFSPRSTSPTRSWTSPRCRSWALACSPPTPTGARWSRKAASSSSSRRTRLPLPA